MYKLALALGMTVKRLMKEMDEDELEHWMAYDSVSPIGDGHSDFLAAMICQTVANRTGGKNGEGEEPFKITDYFPDFWKTKKADTGPTPQQLWAKIGHIHAIITELNMSKGTQQ